MYVIKRSGNREPVHFDKITARLRRLCYGLDHKHVDPALVAQKVCLGVFNGVTTTQLDELAAETAIYMSTTHPDYGTLASRIFGSNLHKNTPKKFSDCISQLYNFCDLSGRKCPMIAENVYQFVINSKDQLDNAIDEKRDFGYDYFGLKTLEKSYLLKINSRVVERPQYMLMRVACGLHCPNRQKVLETYDLLSQKAFTHASPTLFNAGTPNPQLSSCFLLTMSEDSIEGIFDTLKQCAKISKNAGGIGLSVHNIRASGSLIRGTNGTSNGLVPMLRVYNNAARYVDQGGGKRKGAFAIYLEPWHADIEDFLMLRFNNGVEELRCRDLFLALWIPDLFMERVKTDGNWSLFCPDLARGLADCFGSDFEALYTKYECDAKLVKKTIKARSLWNQILASQIETGTPYMLYKDACNRKSNQQNLGTIKSSNLCSEIVQYSSPTEIAVCNLASIALPACVKNLVLANIKLPKPIIKIVQGYCPLKVFDHKKLVNIVQVVTRNLDRIIDINQYPVQEAKVSNLRHRPIGIGVQGLAEVFMLLRLPFDSPQAKKLNQEIFETIYFSALQTSNELAIEKGPYESFAGSPASRGILQFDMWDNEKKVTSGREGQRWNWSSLKSKIIKSGLRNSLLVAPMPTASTSQILGHTESFEPLASNIYVRRTSAGEFICFNKYLFNDLFNAGLWNTQIKNQLILHNGSVQQLDIPTDLKGLYKTVWEIDCKSQIEMAADRGRFIDQSQSFNVHMAAPTLAKLTSMHFYGWNLGLKTGMYYLRSRPAAEPIKFTVQLQERPQATENPLTDSTTLNNDDNPIRCPRRKTQDGECMACSA